MALAETTAGDAGHVLVPLDGSSASGAALPVAIALAEMVGAGVHLVQVLDVPSSGHAGRAGVLGVAQAVQESRAAVEAELGRLVDRVARSTSRPVTHAVVEGTNVARLLLEHAASTDIRVVVMTTRARGALGRAVLGSVADRVAREAPMPVVLVPPAASAAASTDALTPSTVRRVVVPLDGSLTAQYAVDAILSLRGDAPLELLLVEVLAPGLLTAAAVPDASRDARDAQRGTSEALESLEAVGALLRRDDVRVSTRAVVDPRPADAICRLAREETADLIAMTTRGRGGIARLARGSVADGVVRGSEVPVLLVTPGDAPVR